MPHLAVLKSVLLVFVVPISIIVDAALLGLGAFPRIVELFREEA